LRDELGVSDLGSCYWYSEAADTARVGSCCWCSEAADTARVGSCCWCSEAADAARVGCSYWIRDGGCELGDGDGGIGVYEGVLANLFGINYTSLSSSTFLSRLFSVQLGLNSSWFRSRLRVLV
jgi:hypothetical protein